MLRYSDFTIFHPGVFTIIHPPLGFLFSFLPVSLLHGNPHASLRSVKNFSFGHLTAVRVNCGVAGAEDRATQGCDPSADPGAEIGWERVPLAPPVQTNLGTKAINPGGLGAKPPVVSTPYLSAHHSQRLTLFHRTFDRSLVG